MHGNWPKSRSMVITLVILLETLIFLFQWYFLWIVWKYVLYLCFHLIQFLSPSFRYVIVYKKGYQETDGVISTVNTKVKGTAYVNFTTHFHSPLFQGMQIYDPADYVIPPQVWLIFVNFPLYIQATLISGLDIKKICLLLDHQMP